MQAGWLFLTWSWANFFDSRVGESLLRSARGGLGDEFLEARILPERSEHRIQAEQRGSERHVCGIKRAFVRCREQFLQSGHSALGLAHFRGHAGKDLD